MLNTSVLLIRITVMRIRIQVSTLLWIQMLIRILSLI
jgi:hypothetical protein